MLGARHEPSWRDLAREKEDAMAEAVAGTSPLQVLRPPRVLDELSGRIDQLTPTAVNDYARVWQRSVPPSAFSVYVGDFWQRSVLFLDILRERGNQHQEMLAHGVSLKNRTRKPPLRRGRRFRSVHRGPQSRRHPRAGLQLASGRARVRCCRTRFGSQKRPLSDLPAALDQDGERPAGCGRGY